MRIIRYMFTNPREAAILWVFLIIIIAGILALLNASAADWRYMYCTANEAQAIECTAKGWW